MAIGRTLHGRLLRVIYVPDPEPKSVFIITAYDLQGKPAGQARCWNALLPQPPSPDSLPYMARPLAKIQEEIRTLSAPEKEALLRLLWEELDGPSDPDVEAAWLEEVRRRGQEIDAGQVELVPADQVFRKLEASLKK